MVKYIYNPFTDDFDAVLTTDEIDVAMQTIYLKLNGSNANQTINIGMETLTADTIQTNTYNDNGGGNQLFSWNVTGFGRESKWSSPTLFKFLSQGVEFYDGSNNELMTILPTEINIKKAVNIEADNVNLTMGAAGVTDYYQKFDGTDAQFYTSGVFNYSSPAGVDTTVKYSAPTGKSCLFFCNVTAAPNSLLLGQAGATSNILTSTAAGDMAVSLRSGGAIRMSADTGFDAAEGINLLENGRFGIKTITPDAVLQVVGDCKFGDDNTNYAEISTTGDLVFVGSSGLPFAEIYARDNTTTTSTSTTKTQVLIFDTNGQSNLMTPDHSNDHITVTKAGKYKVDSSISIKNSAGVAHVVSLEMYKNNGTTVFNNIHAGRTLGTGTDVGNLTMSGIVDLAANDTLEIWITSSSGTARTITIEDISFCVIQIGG